MPNLHLYDCDGQLLQELRANPEHNLPSLFSMLETTPVHRRITDLVNRLVGRFSADTRALINRSGMFAGAATVHGLLVDSIQDTAVQTAIVATAAKGSYPLLFTPHQEQHESRLIGLQLAASEINWHNGLSEHLSATAAYYQNFADNEEHRYEISESTVIGGGYLAALYRAAYNKLAN